MNSKKAIGIFDSGIGGLTVLSEIRKRMPYDDIVYFGDTARVPYGSKSANTIKRFATEAILFLINLNVKFIVCACNTVSALALPQLQQQFNVPMIDVIEPGVKGALQKTKNQKIGIIGTRATIGTQIYETLLKKINPSLSTWSIATPLLTSLVEEDWIDKAETESIIRQYLQPLLENHVDTLILGCTHYPFLKKKLMNVVGPRTELIDSAEWTAIATQQKLRELQLASSSGEGKTKFYFSDRGQLFVKQARKFLDFPVDSVHAVVLEEGTYFNTIGKANL